MSVVIRKVLPEEVAELKVISEDTFRETFAHDNTEAQLQGYFDTALSEEVLLDEITHEESRYFFILVDGEKAGFLKTNVGSAQTEQHLDNAFQFNGFISVRPSKAWAWVSNSLNLPYKKLVI